MAPGEVERLLSFLASLDIAPPAGWEEKIVSLHQSLVTANRRLNLSRITSLEDFLYRHVADSLLVAAVLPAIRDTDLEVADVGCGGGFPGLPLALTFPRLSITEIDSSRKKIAEVERFIEDLAVPRSRALAARARELAREDAFQGSFDIVLARAVSDTGGLIRESRLLIHPLRGALISYKTPRLVGEERQLVHREAAKAGLKARESEILRLPDGHGERQFWIIERGSEAGE